MQKCEIAFAQRLEHNQNFNNIQKTFIMDLEGVMSMLDQRKIKLLREILNSNGGIRIDNLAEKMKISRRSAYYDIKIINEWLASNNLNPIISSRKNGFSITENEYPDIYNLLPTISNYDYEMSVEERIAFIITSIACSKSKIGIEKIGSFTHVARTTTLKDLKGCGTYLQAFNVSLEYDRNKGYFLMGKERDVRGAIASAISTLLRFYHEELLDQKLQVIFSELNLDIHIKEVFNEISHLIIKIESDLKRKFNDRMVRFITYYFILIQLRLKTNKFIEYSPEESQQISVTQEYLASHRIYDTLCQFFKNEKYEDEVIHIAIQLLCASLDAYYMNPSNNITEKIEKNIVPDLIHEFELLACVKFENKKVLEKNLYVHFLPAYFRTLYQIHLENPIKEDIKKEYTELYNLTSSALKPVEEKLKISFNDSEISYIAMHFGSWFKKQGIDLHKKNIAIVCPSGIATSNFIAKQIINLLPDECNVRTYSYREFDSSKTKFDLVVSTSYLNNQKNMLKVNPVLSTEEKKDILKALGYKRKAFYKSEIVHDVLDIVEKYSKVENMKALVEDLKEYFSDDLSFHEEAKYKPMLRELLIENNIQISQEVKDWKAAIQVASKPLLDNQYIDQSYVDAMINTVINVGPYFIVYPLVAIPHARPEDGVNKLSMSLLKLNEIVSFSDDQENQVKLVIILAAEDNTSHLKALSQLTELLSNESDINSILGSRSKDEILKIIHKY